MDSYEKFVRLANVAANHGGFWVSAGGGTFRVATAIISRKERDSFEEGIRKLKEAFVKADEDPGFMGQIWHSDWGPEDYRWDVRVIAKAAVR